MLLVHIRELVDSLYRDGADMQYIQYLSKGYATQPRMHFKLKEVPSVHLWVILQPAKITQKHRGQKCAPFLLIMILFNSDNSQMVWVLTVIYTQNQCSSKLAGSPTLSVLIIWTEIVLVIHSHMPAVSVRMHTHSLISKPWLLGTRLALTFELKHYDVLIDTMY